MVLGRMIALMVRALAGIPMEINIKESGPMGELMEEVQFK
jgi:hypothetical protein